MRKITPWFSFSYQYNVLVLLEFCHQGYIGLIKRNISLFSCFLKKVDLMLIGAFSFPLPFICSQIILYFCHGLSFYLSLLYWSRFSICFSLLNKYVFSLLVLVFLTALRVDLGSSSSTVDFSSFSPVVQLRPSLHYQQLIFFFFLSFLSAAVLNLILIFI